MKLAIAQDFEYIGNDYWSWRLLEVALSVVPYMYSLQLLFSMDFGTLCLAL